MGRDESGSPDEMRYDTRSPCLCSSVSFPPGTWETALVRTRRIPWEAAAGWQSASGGISATNPCCYTFLRKSASPQEDTHPNGLPPPEGQVSRQGVPRLGSEPRAKQFLWRSISMMQPSKPKTGVRGWKKSGVRMKAGEPRKSGEEGTPTRKGRGRIEWDWKGERDRGRAAVAHRREPARSGLQDSHCLPGQHAQAAVEKHNLAVFWDAEKLRPHANHLHVEDSATSRGQRRGCCGESEGTALGEKTRRRTRNTDVYYY